MIVTRAWLQEWIDISDKSTEALCETLNSIGLEVDSVEKLRIPEKVVVGRVLSCEKHPDADKLNVCQVDLGDETTQIVCGAKNVAAGQTVAVATIGADLGNGFVIKKAKLRGVESNGMICGSTEIGLPQMNDGIMVLDESIGELVTGRELRTYPLLNDDIIEVELTANRGDALSVRGIARDLAAAYDRTLRAYERSFKDDRRGIARVLRFQVVGEPEARVVYRFAEFEPCEPRLLEAFRIACAGKYHERPLHQKVTYAIHSTGVILRVYDFDQLYNDEGKVTLELKREANGVDVLRCNGKVLSQIGLNQDAEISEPKGRHLILEASYVDPDTISARKTELGLEADDLYYNTSRGSETDLELGLDFLCDTISKECGARIYGGEERYMPKTEERILKVSQAFIDNFIGQPVDPAQVVAILSRLGISCMRKEDFFIIVVPDFRTDIYGVQDIVEELVRFIGIDNIVAKPLEIIEQRRLNEAYNLYKKRNKYRIKAAGAGFFESVHYFFANRALQQKYGLPVLDEALDLQNPISEELNTLRTTLVMHLLESASSNIKNGRKRVALFELGRVVDEKRHETEKMAFVFSGHLEEASLKNHGKPVTVDFFSFADKVSAVIGAFELKAKKEVEALFSPYEYATIEIDGKSVGYIARVHANAEKDFDLPRTYVCEVDFAALPYETVQAKSYAKFPSVTRDLSLLVPKTVAFDTIKEALREDIPVEIREFYPIDLFESEDLGENVSLTVRFVIRSDEKTLTEEEITAMIDKVLERLKSHLGIVIR